MSELRLHPRNHYETLGVAPDAPPEVIRAAYRSLAKKYHPDGEAPDGERIRRINEAWGVLGRPSSRAAYDERLAGTDRLAEPDRTPEQPVGFSHGVAGWGEDAGGTTAAGGEADGADVVGAPGWGEGTEAVAAPGTPPDAAVGWDQAVDRPGVGPHVALVALLLPAVVGVTWFGVAQVDVGWALASGGIAAVAGVVAWRWSTGLAYLPMLGAWACAVVAVVHASDLLRWRGWQDLGGWVGGWLTALLWVGGVVFVTLLLVAAFNDDPAAPDDWADGV